METDNIVKQRQDTSGDGSTQTSLHVSYKRLQRLNLSAGGIDVKRQVEALACAVDEYELLVGYWTNDH